MVGEEAARLGSPAPLVEQVSQVVRASADTSIVKVIREYDAQPQRLQEALMLERAKLRHLALPDPLTGLANRALLLDRLGHAFAGAARRGDRVGVLFLDLNGFKAVNDRFGHAAGDHPLVGGAGCLASLVRASDTVARLGGDEFVIITSVSAAGEGTLMRLGRVLVGDALQLGDLPKSDHVERRGCTEQRERPHHVGQPRRSGLPIERSRRGDLGNPVEPRQGQDENHRSWVLHPRRLSASRSWSSAGGQARAPRRAQPPRYEPATGP